MQVFPDLLKVGLLFSLVLQFGWPCAAIVLSINTKTGLQPVVCWYVGMYQVPLATTDAFNGLFVFSSFFEVAYSLSVV